MIQRETRRQVVILRHLPYRQVMRPLEHRCEAWQQHPYSITPFGLTCSGHFFRSRRMKDVCVLCGRTGHASKDCPMGKRAITMEISATFSGPLSRADVEKRLQELVERAKKKAP